MFREPYPNFWRRCLRMGIVDLTNLPEDMDPRKGAMAICNAALPAFDPDSRDHLRRRDEEAEAARSGLRHVSAQHGGDQRGGAFWVAGHTMLLGKASTLRRLRAYKVGKLSERVRTWWRQRTIELSTAAFARAVRVLGLRWRRVYLQRRAEEIKDDVSVMQCLAKAVLATTFLRKRRHRVLSARILQHHWRTLHARNALATMARRLQRFEEVSTAAKAIQRAARHQIARCVTCMRLQLRVWNL